MTFIKRILYTKIAESLANVEDTSKIISLLNLIQKPLGLYTFILPLKSKTYDVRKCIQTISNSDITSDLNKITVTEDTLSIDVHRNHYIKQILETNFHNIDSPMVLDNNKKNIVVEFSSPNIAKPFHLGHLRSTIIGNFVANINSFLNNNVKKINYLGDWGTQYGFIELGMNMSNFDSTEIQKNPIQHLYNAYVLANKLACDDPTILDKAKEIFRQLEIGETSAHEKWELFRKYTIAELQKTYKRLGTTFDEYHWESMYSVTNIKEILSLMEKKNLLTHDAENRKVINLDNKVIPIIKSDGTSLYLTRDIAAAIDRYERYKFDSMYYVVDNTQNGHFTNLVEILNKMDMPWAQRLKHIRYGRIIGISTRKGTAVFLEDILNEMREILKERQMQTSTTKVSLDISDDSSDILGITALIINDLKQKRHKDYKFDPNSAFNMDKQNGIRLQYVHCRLSSLEENSGGSLVSECDPSLLKESIVDELILMINEFDCAVLRSYQTLEPCILVKYLCNLSHVINRALKILRIKDEPVDVGNQRLLLFHVAKNYLAQGMKLLGVTPLNKM